MKTLNMQKLLIVLCFCFPFVACTDDEKTVQFGEEDHLVFGTFYGECAGNCTVLYKIQSGLLFEDNVEIGIPEVILFNILPMSEAKYLIAEELTTTFPSDLIDSDKEVYGCPDCHDQGGVYLELKQGDDTRKWSIDTGNDEQSAQIIAYKVRLAAVMDSIR